MIELQQLDGSRIDIDTNQRRLLRCKEPHGVSPLPLTPVARNLAGCAVALNRKINAMATVYGNFLK
jgi:hypothetical protein